MKDKKNANILLATTKEFMEFREADKIISYLIDPDGPAKLNAALKKKYDLYVMIHGLRMRYKRHDDIMRILRRFYDMKERQSRIAINETEYIFGKVIKVDRQFEKAFLLEMARKNIKIAMDSKDSEVISKALKVYNEILGEAPDLSDIPDFSKFEQHNYNVVINTGMKDLIEKMLKQGPIDLSQLFPSKVLQKLGNGD